MIYKNYKKEKIPEMVANTKYIKTIDVPLLLDLFNFQTPTGDKPTQKAFLKWIRDEFITKNNIKCQISYDNYGGMYIKKGQADVYPCVVSHIDTVHDYDINFKSYQCGDYVIGLSEGEQCGLGADPKAGLYILLQLLKRFDNIKCVLFLNEELGCQNSREARVKFFSDCSFVMQFDRRSFTTDVIENTNGVQVLSQHFKDMINPVMKEYKYSFNYGTCTDVGELSKLGVGINTFNIS